MLVFNQPILLSQKPQIHSFLCSGLAQDQWRPQNPTVQVQFSSVQLVEEWIREEEFQTGVWYGFSATFWAIFSEIHILVALVRRGEKKKKGKKKKKTQTESGYCSIMAHIAARYILIQMWVIITAVESFEQGSINCTIGQWARWWSC